jgi:glycosyltransferase involved in cell wall biosynthesis
VISLSVCAPAYNEEAGIKQILCKWISSLEQAVESKVISEYEIVICDDGSSDQTVKVLESAQSKNLTIVRNYRNEGPGVALRKAIQSSKMNLVITIDSDGQFLLDEAIAWINYSDPKSVILGYRHKSDRITLRIGSAISTKLHRITLKSRIPDANCMLKLIPGDIARSLDLRAIGLNYSGEMTFLICTTQVAVHWKKVTHQDRTTGRSSARFFRDGYKRILFQAFLIFELALIKKGILSVRNGISK